MNVWLKLAARAAFGAVVLLSADATLAGTQPDKAMAPGEGAVMLIVAIDLPSDLVFTWGDQIQDLSVERVDGGNRARFKLAPRLDGMTSSRLYAGSLPPGRYRIRDIFEGVGGSPNPGENDLAQFEVVAGEVTWLGSIMVNEGRYGVDKAAWAYESDPSIAIGQRLLDGAYPELAAAKPKVATHWLPFSLGHEAAANALAKLRKGATGLNGAGTWGDDGFCLGARHGLAKCWNRTAGYQALETGSPYILRSVTRLSDGRVLAGGEGSTLLYSEDEGKHWSDAGASLPWGYVETVVDIGRDEALFLLVSGDRARLYRGPLSTREWKLLGEYPFDALINLTSWLKRVPLLRVQGRGAVLALPKKQAYYLNLDSGDLRKLELPGNITELVFTGDGVIRCACNHLVESRDQGRTWQERLYPRGVQITMPAFRDANEGFAYYWSFYDTKLAKILGTHDGGNTWSELALPDALPTPRTWALPTYTRDGSTMVLAGWSMDKKRNFFEEVHVSLDGGKIWQRVKNLPDWAPPDHVKNTAH